MTRPTYTPLTSAIGISATLPEEFEVTAWTADRDELMGFRHKELVLEGVQFHPESFLTEEGPQLIQNFLRL